MRVIDRLNKSDVPRRISITLKVQMIDLRRDPPDRSAIALDDPERRVSVSEKGIEFAMKMKPALQHKRRHPIWIALVDKIRQRVKLPPTSP